MAPRTQRPAIVDDTPKPPLPPIEYDVVVVTDEDYAIEQTQELPALAPTNTPD